MQKTKEQGTMKKNKMDNMHEMSGAPEHTRAVCIHEQYGAGSTTRGNKE